MSYMKFAQIYSLLRLPKQFLVQLKRNNSHNVIKSEIKNQKNVANVAKYFEFHGDWPKLEMEKFIKDMRLLPDFLDEAEETQLLEEIEPYMKRLRYEFDHWDDAIHGFRETERKHWYPHNRAVLERVREIAFNGEVMPYVHVLDLAEQGVIKPHVDSTRYCGNIISGMSLLSPCVMRLVRTDEQKYKQDAVASNNDEYRNQPAASKEHNFYANILLPRRSLYIMSDTSRYNFTHEILANELSKFRGENVHKTRRISIICRNEVK